MDAVQEIKSRLSLTEVVQKYTPLQKAGRNMKGLCPFHNDHNPSMIVSEEKGLAWCFSCNSGGDIFSFVEKVENVDFAEALKILADMAGVELIANSAGSVVKKEKKLRFIELLDASQKIFEQNLEKAKPVAATIEKRQINAEIIKKFGVGYALDDFHSLEKKLSEKGFSHKEMLDAGVVSAKDEKGVEVYDRFRKRITFPIWDLHGSIRGFGARIVGDGEPKYLNSPETVLYQKSQLLYGLNFAKQAIKAQDFCLVVEGYFDVIACHNAQIENVVSVSGTALSESHIKLLKRFSSNIVFAFDADAAGQDAAKRAIEIGIKAEANLFIISIPDGKDPDEALRENAAAFTAALEKKMPVMEFLFQDAFLVKDIENL